MSSDGEATNEAAEIHNETTERTENETTEISVFTRD